MVRAEELNLIARLVAAEAKEEPYDGKVAVAAVVLNRTRHPDFPSTIPGVIFEPWAFESVMNRHFYQPLDLDAAPDHRHRPSYFCSLTAASPATFWRKRSAAETGISACSWASRGPYSVLTVRPPQEFK